MFLATTRGAVLRGTTLDSFNEEIDDNSAGAIVAPYSDLPLSLIERSKRVQDPTTGTWGTVRYFAGRLPANVVLRDGDRIRDNRTGRVYAIDEKVGTVRGIGGSSSLTLDLRLTSG